MVNPILKKRRALYHVLVGGIFGLLFCLGVWQIERGFEKQALEQQSRLAFDAEPLSGSQVHAVPRIQALRFRRLQVVGRFLDQKVFLWDHQRQGQQWGYRIVLPFIMMDVGWDQKVLFVDVGWIKKSVPELKFEAELKQFLLQLSGLKAWQGWIDVPHVPPAWLVGASSELRSDHWPRLIQHLDLNAMGRALGHPRQVLPIVLRLSEQKPRSDFGSWKSFGYAGQWFLFALLLLFYAYSQRVGIREST